MEYICKPKKVQIYVNTNRKTMKTIQSELGCDVIINGGLYNLSKFTPECCLKVDGTILANDGYKYWGYGWDNYELNLTSDLSAYKNYICCVCLVKDHVKEPLYIGSALKGSRQRTVIGRFDDGRIWVMAQTSPTKTPEELQDYVLKLDLKDAIMLDGGGSTQGMTHKEQIESNRIVHNYICIWEEKEEVNSNINIQYLPTSNSDGFKNANFVPKGIVLHSTATPGVNALSMQKYYNKPKLGKSVHAFVDDIDIVQCMPWTKRAGHVGSGSKGSFNSTHIGIEMCEPKGLTYNSGGWAIIKYSPPNDYFNKIWNNAVNLCAKLCCDYNLNPLGNSVLVSHNEVYALGYGSNHADVMHWFKWENKTMDNFRQAVAEKMKFYKTNYNDEGYVQWKKYMEMYITETGKNNE